MGLPQVPPGGGGKSRHTHWHYVKTEKGKTWNAWMAGKTHWYSCHTKGRSKPCLHAMTGGALLCEICSPLNEAETIGYVPLYREIDGRPTMVIVHEYSREAVDKIRLHQPVIVGRGTEDSDGVWVAAHPKSTSKYTSSLRERMIPGDMTETLLALWKLPGLTEWYRRTQSTSDKGVSLPQGTAVKEDGKPYSPMMQGAAKRWAEPTIQEPTVLGDVVDVQREQLERLQRLQPSKNGKHPPEG